MRLTRRRAAVLVLPMPDIDPDTARAMQRAGADAIRGTPAARERASKAGRSVSPEAAQIRATKAAKSVSPEAAKLRAQKAAAARWAKTSNDKP